MTYTTRVSLECSYGLYQPWELQEATIEHEAILTYSQLRVMAMKQVGGGHSDKPYTTYGVMTIVEESCGN